MMPLRVYDPPKRRADSSQEAADHQPLRPERLIARSAVEEIRTLDPMLGKHVL